jgi:hypothetical protein
VNLDQTFKLQQAVRPQAYKRLHDQIVDYLTTNRIDRVVIKGSAVSKSGSGKGHLDAAELRGVVMAAAAAVTTVSVRTKAQISKTFGARNVDDYVKDDAYWTTAVAGVALKKGSREAALLLLADRG